MRRPRNVPRSSVQIQQLLWSRRTAISLPLPCVSMALPSALPLVSSRATPPHQMHPSIWSNNASFGSVAPALRSRTPTIRLLWTFYLLSWTRLCGASPLIAVWLISLLRATPLFAPRPNLQSTPSDVVLCRPRHLPRVGQRPPVHPSPKTLSVKTGPSTGPTALPLAATPFPFSIGWSGLLPSWRAKDLPARTMALLRVSLCASCLKARSASSCFPR